jgi:tRNA (guanine37-N1)-methyltransferase
LEDLKLIGGDRNTEVVHKEYGCPIKLDPQKVFFSPRELTERQRIASQIKAGENVLIMFSGSMPYGIIIAKKQPEVNRIYGVEINPDAHRYAIENVRMNKLSHKIILINDDVRKSCEKLGKFDRIIMPFAVGAFEYLDVAFDCIKAGGIVHFYHIGPESDLFAKAEDIVKKLKRRFEIIRKVKVLPFGTRYWKICLDVKVL